VFNKSLLSNIIAVDNYHASYLRVEKSVQKETASDQTTDINMSPVFLDPC